MSLRFFVVALGIVGLSGYLAEIRVITYIEAILSCCICAVFYYLRFELPVYIDRRLQAPDASAHHADITPSVPATLPIAPSSPLTINAKCPPPLKCTIEIGLYLDSTFWEKTLDIPAEIVPLKNSINFTNDIPEIAANFEDDFYAHIEAVIHLWEGGYRQIRVDAPKSQTRSIECYAEDSDDRALCEITLPDCCNGESRVSTPELVLLVEFDDQLPQRMQFYAKGGRFGRTKKTGWDDADPLAEIAYMFLNVPLIESELAATHTRRRGREIWPDVHSDLLPWERSYYGVDESRGLAWEIVFHDHALFQESEGNGYAAGLILERRRNGNRCAE